ncbi:unnamed protein product [Closterium sp. NIES-53]
MTTLRVLLHVAAQRDYELHSLDFSTAFLQGSLHEEIWLRRPLGFTRSFPAGTQWSLRQPVYGLRQAPREWHDTHRTTLAALRFVPSTADPSLFLRTDTSLPPFYVLVYVDDLVFATTDTEALTLVLQRFGFQYSSPQLTPLSTSHSLSAPPSDKSVEPSGPYLELVGCLMYLMTCSRPDLAYPLSLLARYVAPGRHRKVHWDAAKRVLRYLCSTLGMGLVLGGRGQVVLTGHANASWVDDSATQRSSQGYTFSLGSGSVSWRSTRSSSVLSSSCETEIYAGAMAAQELRWLTYLLTDLGEQSRSPPVLYRGQLRLAYVAARANTADVFTKALPPGDNQHFVTVLGLLALLLLLTGLVTIACSGYPPLRLWGSTGPAKAPLALVHMDVVGPTRAPSLSGSRYFLTIVDDHTRAVWVYPLKIKGEVAAAVLKEWMPRAQRESGHKVKVIRTDNGGESIGADFEAVLKKKGIQHQLTVPYNPQHNGVAEQFNRTLHEGARTLLGRAGLPDPFWVTALRQVALVKNRVLGDKQWVPYTKWYRIATAVNMLRAYGCMVVFHVPKEKRGKLEASGRWRVHMGLAKDHKGWLIWDLTSQQLTVSRDVKFLETLYYKEWKQQQQKLPTTPLIIEDDEVQRPSRQVQISVSEEEISGPKVVRAGSVAEQSDEDEIAHCYWAAVPEPKTLAEALSGPDAEKWKQSVKEEYDSLRENETWELCELPPGKKAISSKLIFRHKYGPYGELTRYKSRLVAKGFQQTKGKDFDDISAPVGKGTTIRVMLGTVANRGWRIKQVDITTAFLNGIILEELYMLQPEGLDDGNGRVCRLKKAISGLKQAPRAWEQFLMLLVYVDDILLFSESSAMIERVEEMLEMQFKCSKMGDVKYYLGMHVERDLDKGVLRLHQRKYCEGLA